MKPESTKSRLCMEPFREIADVCDAWRRGRVSASKARELAERIAFDGVRLDEIDPRNLGGSDVDAVAWFVRRQRGEIRPKDVADALSMDQHYAAIMLHRVARRGLALRVRRGIYSAKESSI